LGGELGGPILKIRKGGNVLGRRKLWGNISALGREENLGTQTGRVVTIDELAEG